MWLRQWTLKIGITILLGLTPAFIKWFSPKSHTQGIFNWRRVLRTYLLMFSLIWCEIIIGLKCRILGFMFIKVRNYLAPKQKTEDKLGFLLPIVSMAVTRHRICLGPLDMYLTRKTSFKTPFSSVCIKESHRSVLHDRVSACTFARCKHPECFPILRVHKVSF